MGLYFLPPMSVGGKPLRKVDLLADIRPDVEEEVCDSDTIVLPPPVKPIFVDTCKTGITCIEDYSDSTMRGMKHFYEALSKVKTMKRPVRIAYFGDSFIEADIFTADLREMLQQEFGGCGVGYVPVTSSISGYRPTVRHTFGGWSSHSSNDSVGFDKIQQDISGHYFFPREGAYVQLKGQSKYASRLDTCEVSTFYFLNKGFAAVRSKVNNAAEGELHEEVGTGGVQAVVDKAKEYGVPIRVGVNSGSLEKNLVEKYGGVTARGLVESALDKVSIITDMGYDNLVISIKSSDVLMCIRAHEELAKQTDFPLHVGITESGTVYSGSIKSAVGLGTILYQGIGDTVRVSLTGDPVKEVQAAKLILQTLGLYKGGVQVVSCPTCGRTQIDLISLAGKVEEMVKDFDLDIKVAVMGCAVNGPGEAKEADIGIAGGIGEGLLIKKGEIVKKVPESELLETLRQELLHWKD